VGCTIDMRGRLSRQLRSTAVAVRERTPHVVDVLTAGITDDAHRLPYIVMERLHGTSLRGSLEAKDKLYQRRLRRS
jgi:hypothetical protein